MGFFDAFQQFLGESMQSSGPTVSGPDSYFFYYSQVSGEIRRDDDYMREFTEALLQIIRKRPGDTYLQELGHCCGAVCAELYKPFSSHGAIWRVYYGEEDYNHSFLLKFMTPNAIQKRRNGEALKTGNYRLERGYEEKQAEIARQQAEIARRREELAAKPPLESFLGIKFGVDSKKYIDDDNPREDEDGFVVMKVKANKFLDFAKYIVFASKFDKKVAWVAAVAKKSKLGDADEYVRRVSGLLEQKYGMEFIRDDDVLILPFYDAKKWDPNEPLKPESLKSTIALFFKDDLLWLVARDEMLTKEIEKQNAREKAAAKLLEAQIKKTENENALDAL